MSTLEYYETLATREKSSWKNVHKCKLCPYFTTALFRMINHVRKHRFPLDKFTCDNAKIEPYYCKDCDFKTELTILLKEHIDKYHGFKREPRDVLLSEDFRIQTYVCEKCDFETNFSLKWIQHILECMGKKEYIKSVISSSENESYSCDLKPTDETSWFYCAQCCYKAKLKRTLRCHIMRKHDLKKRYACEKCPFKTRWKSALGVHINRIHLDE